MPMKVRTNQEREGKEAGIRQRRTGRIRNTGSVSKIGRMRTGRMMGVALTSTSMATPVLISLRVTILRRANAASGIRIARPAINLLQEDAVRVLPVHG
jgi:hypothetical protein